MNESFDIAVVGSGSSGIAAAISSARSGCRTLLLDRRAGAGGTGGFSGLTTLCGLHTETRRFINDGFCQEFAEALMREDNVREPVKMGRFFVQVYDPRSFQRLASKLLANERLLTTLWSTPLLNVSAKEHRIRTLNKFQVRAVIDCTGTADVGRIVGEELLATDDSTQAPAVNVSLENVARDLNSPLGGVNK